MQRIKGKISPSEGGCCFCFNNDTEMRFSWELNMYFCLECLLDELLLNPGNRDAQIIASELKLFFK